MGIREDGWVHVDKVVALADGRLHLSVSISSVGYKGWEYMSRDDPFFVLDRLVSDTRETSGNPVHHPEAFVNDGRLCTVSFVQMTQRPIHTK